MSRYKVLLSYDGHNYHGWQSQQRDITIQDTIQEALSIIHKQPIKIVGSGRTDAGVHALNQVFHFDSELNISEDKWPLAINTLLPKDIYIKKVEQVNSDFHARFDAIGKKYRYYLNMGEYDPFMKDHIYQLGYKLNLKLMREAANIFIGKHDFSSFCQNSYDEIADQTREIYGISITNDNDIVCFEFVGDGFMRYMVRMLVQTLIEVGKERLPIADVKMMLDACNKKACPYNAKPEGLYLVDVYYPE